jgi:hypothetical protein
VAEADIPLDLVDCHLLMPETWIMPLVIAWTPIARHMPAHVASNLKSEQQLCLEALVSGYLAA